jgi:hypothetical protein
VAAKLLAHQEARYGPLAESNPLVKAQLATLRQMHNSIHNAKLLNDQKPHIKAIRKHMRNLELIAPAPPMRAQEEAK